MSSCYGIALALNRVTSEAEDGSDCIRHCRDLRHSSKESGAMRGLC